MPKQEKTKAKGLPKRTSNANAKRRRAESWARGQERKRLIREQDERNRQAKLNNGGA